MMPSCGAHAVRRAAHCFAQATRRMPRCFTYASRRMQRPPHVAPLRMKIPSCARRISAVTCFLASHEAQRTCGRGGIGRRVRFRSVWGQPHGGSSPLARTIANSEPSSRWVFYCPDRASDQFSRLLAFERCAAQRLGAVLVNRKRTCFAVTLKPASAEPAAWTRLHRVRVIRAKCRKITEVCK